MRELAGDGHEKVIAKCRPPSSPAADGAGASDPPSKRKFGHGWFMIVHPGSQRILGLEPQTEPENNAVKIRRLGKMVHVYKRVDCFIHDNNCPLQPTAARLPSLRQIAFWPIVRFRGRNRNKK